MLPNNILVLFSITNFIGTISCMLTLLCYFDIISPQSVYFSVPLILHGEVWRVVSHQFFIGTMFSFEFVWNIVFFFNHCYSLESSSFRDRPADFIYMFMFLCSSLTMIAIVFGFMFMSNSLSFAVTYLWCRRNPEAPMALFGLFQFGAGYLPYIMLAQSSLGGGDISTEFAGLVVGHIYYFLEDVFPYMTSKRIRLLKTPVQLEKIVNLCLYFHSGNSNNNNNNNNSVNSDAIFQRNMQRLSELRQRNVAAMNTINEQLNSNNNNNNSNNTNTNANANNNPSTPASPIESKLPPADVKVKSVDTSPTTSPTESFQFYQDSMDHTDLYT